MSFVEGKLGSISEFHTVSAVFSMWNKNPADFGAAGFSKSVQRRIEFDE